MSQNQVKKCCSLKLDRCIYRGLILRSLTVVSIKDYENQISRFVFNTYPCYVFRFSFFITLDIYKDYFKVRLSWWNLMQRFYASILWLETYAPSSSFSWRSCCICTPSGFVTKEFLDLHRVDELKNFAANILLKLVC